MKTEGQNLANHPVWLKDQEQLERPNQSYEIIDEFVLVISSTEESVLFPEIRKADLLNPPVAAADNNSAFRNDGFD